MKMWTNIRVKIKLKKVYKFAVKFNRLFVLVHFGEGNTPEYFSDEGRRICNEEPLRLAMVTKKSKFQCLYKFKTFLPMQCTLSLQTQSYFRSPPRLAHYFSGGEKRRPEICLCSQATAL